jgi:hypothetical protein
VPPYHENPDCPALQEVVTSKQRSLTTKDLLHILRNPYGKSEDEKTRARLEAADEIEYLQRMLMERPLQPETPAATKTAEWSAMLRAEIAAQELLIKRMHDNHPDTQGNGIIGQLRAERLGLLEELLEFEPKRASDECRRGPSCGMLDGAWECNCTPLPAPKAAAASETSAELLRHKPTCMSMYANPETGRYPCDCGAVPAPKTGPAQDAPLTVSKVPL